MTVVLIFISCTILLFATIGRVIITNVNTFCKLQVSLDKSDFIHFLFFLQEKIGFRLFIFFQVIIYC